MTTRCHPQVPNINLLFSMMTRMTPHPYPRLTRAHESTLRIRRHRVMASSDLELRMFMGDTLQSRASSRRHSTGAGACPGAKLSILGHCTERGERVPWGEGGACATAPRWRHRAGPDLDGARHHCRGRATPRRPDRTDAATRAGRSGPGEMSAPSQTRYGRAAGGGHTNSAPSTPGSGRAKVDRLGSNWAAADGAIL
jgi:hypothetical protein